MTASTSARSTPSELVVFELGSHRLGLASESVREILQAVAVTHLPGAPVGVEGVIDLRGQLVPVFDLRLRFALPPQAPRVTDHLLVCTANVDEVVVIRADRILQIRAIADTHDVPEAGASTDPVVRGLARLPDGLVVICDLAAVLTDADLAALARAMATLTSAPPA